MLVELHQLLVLIQYFHPSHLQAAVKVVITTQSLAVLVDQAVVAAAVTELLLVVQELLTKVLLVGLVLMAEQLALAVVAAVLLQSVLMVLQMLRVGMVETA